MAGRAVQNAIAICLIVLHFTGTKHEQRCVEGGNGGEGLPVRVVSYVAVFLIGALGVYLLLAVGALDEIDGLPGPYAEPELSLPTYLSFVGVLLTTVTAVLAAVAIGIGIVAFYTFTGLKAEAQLIAESTASSTASTTAKAVADEALAEVKIREIVLELYATAKKNIEQEEKWGEDPDANQER